MATQEKEAPIGPQDVANDTNPDPKLEPMTEDEEMTLARETYVPGTDEEKRLVRKVDMILLPCLWWMYVLAYLDRGNIVSTEHSYSPTVKCEVFSMLMVQRQTPTLLV